MVLPCSGAPEGRRASSEQNLFEIPPRFHAYNYCQSLHRRGLGGFIVARFVASNSREANGGVAQSVEQRPFKPVVAGSSPAAPTIIPGTHFWPPSWGPETLPLRF